MASRLIVSLSGLSDVPPEAAALAAELDRRGVPLSQLLRPCGADGRVRADTPHVGWMRERRASGDAVVLHGYDHTADPIGSWQPSPLARIGRRAEFATLPRHEAGLRLTAARRVLTTLGLRTDLFVPPRWLASPGTVEALRDQGFAALADENGVRMLQTPDGPVRARLLGFRGSGDRTVGRRGPAERATAEVWRCRLLVAEVARTARRSGLVRINVRAKDLRRPVRTAAVLAAVDAALAVGAVPGTYRSAEIARAA